MAALIISSRQVFIYSSSLTMNKQLIWFVQLVVIVVVNCLGVVVRVSGGIKNILRVVCVWISNAAAHCHLSFNVDCNGCGQRQPSTSTWSRGDKRRYSDEIGAEGAMSPAVASNVAINTFCIGFIVRFVCLLLEQAAFWRRQLRFSWTASWLWTSQLSTFQF